MTSDFSLLKNLQQQLTDLDKKQLRRQRRVTETPCAPAIASPRAASTDPE